MTIKEKLVDMLHDGGMFREQATAVVERVIADPANESMAGRWNDTPEDYPPAILNLAWFSTKRHALAWIDENCPQAWFRGMFEDQVSEQQASA